MEEEENITTIYRECDFLNRNRKAWLLLVMKVVIEMLVNGTAPSAMVKNLESALRIVCSNAIAEELPNIDCMRKMRGVIRILIETLAYYRLEKNKQ